MRTDRAIAYLLEDRVSSDEVIDRARELFLPVIAKDLVGISFFPRYTRNPVDRVVQEVDALEGDNDLIFIFYPNAKMSYIHHFFLGSNLQGRGYGKYIVGNLLYFTREILRYTAMELEAWHIGRYAWGLFGFNCNPAVLHAKRSYLHRLLFRQHPHVMNYRHIAEVAATKICDVDSYLVALKRKRREVYKNLYGEIIKRDPKYWSKDGTSFLLGKWSILDRMVWKETARGYEYWSGRLDFSDGMSMEIANRYYGKYIRDNYRGLPESLEEMAAIVQGGETLGVDFDQDMEDVVSSVSPQAVVPLTIDPEKVDPQED